MDAIGSYLILCTCNFMVQFFYFLLMKSHLKNDSPILVTKSSGNIKAWTVSEYEIGSYCFVEVTRRFMNVYHESEFCMPSNVSDYFVTTH